MVEAERNETSLVMSAVMEQIQAWGYAAKLSLPGPKSHPDFRASISVSHGDTELVVINEHSSTTNNTISLYRARHPFDGKELLSYEEFTYSLLPAYSMISADPNLLSVIKTFIELESDI